MTNVWGVHMPGWVGDEPIEKGYVALGWPKVGDIFALPNDREAARKHDEDEARLDERLKKVAKVNPAPGKPDERAVRAKAETFPLMLGAIDNTCFCICFRRGDTDSLTVFEAAGAGLVAFAFAWPALLLNRGKPDKGWRLASAIGAGFVVLQFFGNMMDA